MKRADWVFAGFFVSLFLSLPSYYYVFLPMKQGAEFQQQLRLAQAEGLPTTLKEYLAEQPSIPPRENDATLYVKLKKLDYVDFRDARYMKKLVTAEPSSKALADAMAFLHKHEPDLVLIDEATTLPHCRFQHEWRLGIADPDANLDYVQAAASMLELRGAVDAAKGLPKQATGCSAQVRKMVAQLREDPTFAGGWCSRYVLYGLLYDLACWCFQHPQERLYQDELRQALAGLSIDFRAEHKLDLVNALTTADLCSTRDGRIALGIKDSDITVPGPKDPKLLSQAEARVQLVKSIRRIWACQDESMQKGSESHYARDSLKESLASFPGADLLYEQNSANLSDPRTDRVRLERNRLLYTAFLRGIESGVPEKSIRTDDLVSPETGKPLTYQFDGLQMTIKTTTFGSGEPYSIKIPPSKPKSPKP